MFAHLSFESYGSENLAPLAGIFSCAGQYQKLKLFYLLDLFCPRCELSLIVALAEDATDGLLNTLPFVFPCSNTITGCS